MLFFGMPVPAAVASAGYGGCFGLFPIGWIVLNAVFLYHLTVRSGQFEVVKRSVAAISPDRRMQALLIAFSFGTFIEGAAGFGTPVAISAALLIGLKFKPLYAAGLALIANTSPVAFGSLGTPIITLAKVAGLEGLSQAQAEMLLSQMAGRQLPLFSLIIPAWLVAVMSGWQGVVGCWPAILVCGGSFATIQFLTANFHGPALVDVLGGVGSLVSLTVLLRFWQPKEVWRFPEENDRRRGRPARREPLERGRPPTSGGRDACAPVDAAYAPSYDEGRRGIASHGLTRRQIAYAWMPWVLLSVMIFLWGWPSWKETLNGGPKDAPNWLAGVSKISFEVPYLHNVVYRNAPVVELVEQPDGSRGPPKPRRPCTTSTGSRPRARASSWPPCSRRSGCGSVCGAFCLRVRTHAVARPLGAVHDRLHVGPGLHHEIQRGRRHARPGLHAHRLVLSVLRADARLAGRGLDRLRHLGQRPVRQPATHHGRTTGTEPDAHRAPATARAA